MKIAFQLTSAALIPSSLLLLTLSLINPLKVFKNFISFFLKPLDKLTQGGGILLLYERQCRFK